MTSLWITPFITVTSLCLYSMSMLLYHLILRDFWIMSKSELPTTPFCYGLAHCHYCCNRDEPQEVIMSLAIIFRLFFSVVHNTQGHHIVVVVIIPPSVSFTLVAESRWLEPSSCYSGHASSSVIRLHLLQMKFTLVIHFV